MEPGRRL